MQTAVVRCTGVWQHEKATGIFGGGKMEKVEKPAMLEFRLSHFPHPTAFAAAAAAAAAAAQAHHQQNHPSGEAALASAANDDSSTRALIDGANPSSSAGGDAAPSPAVAWSPGSPTPGQCGPMSPSRNAPAESPLGPSLGFFENAAASPVSTSLHQPVAVNLPSATLGQLSGTDSSIILFLGDNVPPASRESLTASSNKTQVNASKVVAKQRADATKCTVHLHELVHFSVLPDKDENDPSRAGVEQEGGNSLSTIRQDSDSMSELNAQERVKPFTVALTFVARPGAPNAAVKGTEDIFGTAADRADKEHPLRSIKFVVTGMVASSQQSQSQQQQQSSAGVAAASSNSQPSSPSSDPSMPHHSGLMTMKERFCARVVRPIESFLLPFGRLHIFPLVSPVSGKGMGVQLYNSAKKVFARSHHIVHEAMITKYRGHAEDWMAESEDFFTTPLAPGSAGGGSGQQQKGKTANRSVIVAFGGDGMLHEVINGWFKREKLTLGPSAAAFDGRPIFAPFPTGSGCAMAAVLGVIDPLDTAMAVIHSHWIAHDSFVITPTGPAAEPKFTKPEVVPPSPAPSKPGELPPSWDCIGWAKLKDKTPPPRIGVLSMSTGLISDVDKGSETMRYLGNARFTVEMVRMVMGSTPKYSVSVRYKPSEVAAVNDVSASAAYSPATAVSASSSAAPGGDKKNEKPSSAAATTQVPSKIAQFVDAGYENSGGKFPPPEVRRAIASPLYKQNTSEMTFSPSLTAGPAAAVASAAAAPAASAGGGEKKTEGGASAAAAAAAAGDEANQPDHDDDDGDAATKRKADQDESERKKWKTLLDGTVSKDDQSYIVMICNVVALARDCIFAPYARGNDGALDIVTFDGNMGKVELTSALLKMEDGSHVDSGPKEKIRYVKASEVTVKASSGLLMCDGEIIPQCPCHVQVAPRSLKLVRTTRLGM